MTITKNCPNCNKDFNYEKRERRKYCSQSCAAIYSNKNRKIGTPRDCEECGKGFKKKRITQKFCSRKCMGINKSKKAYNYFLETNGEYHSYNCTPHAAKNHILIEQECRCSVCNMENKWNDKNIVFVLDHIDGNSHNNKRENLRLVCPNCDSQLDTYKSKNKNSGRHYRKERYKEGKSF